MKRIIVLLGVVGVSFSAIFVRWSTAPSMIIALYRMVFAALLLAPAAAALALAVWNRRMCAKAEKASR